MLITFLIYTSFLFAAEWNDESKYEHMLKSLRQGQVVVCIDDCYLDYGLFLNALDRHYEEDKPKRPVNAPLYPDSGLLISYYMITKDHFSHLPVSRELYENIDNQLANDTENLVPVLRALSANDPFFLRYITWVSGREKSVADERLDLRDLVMGDRQLDLFQDGKYKDAIQIYKFCRNERIYPCRLIVKDRDGKFARTTSGKIWSIPSLAMAANRKPYYKVSGDTPSGVYTVDSVMPSADQIRSFGKYRRLILNFVPKSINEQNHMYLLPQSHHSATWWKEAVTGRQIGRNLFRIHGSGKIVTKPSDPYYTFAPTQGCINTRENAYQDVTFKDQRILLDTLMTGLRLPVSYANETKIQGLLYVINIDGKTEPVTLEELEPWGIK